MSPNWFQKQKIVQQGHQLDTYIQSLLTFLSFPDVKDGWRLQSTLHHI